MVQSDLTAVPVSSLQPSSIFSLLLTTSVFSLQSGDK
jgi:hypothetical protein